MRLEEPYSHDQEAQRDMVDHRSGGRGAHYDDPHDTAGDRDLGVGDNL